MLRFHFLLYLSFPGNVFLSFWGIKIGGVFKIYLKFCWIIIRFLLTYFFSSLRFPLWASRRHSLIVQCFLCGAWRPVSTPTSAGFSAATRPGHDEGREDPRLHPQSLCYRSGGFLKCPPARVFTAPRHVGAQGTKAGQPPCWTCIPPISFQPHGLLSARLFFFFYKM